MPLTDRVIDDSQMMANFIESTVELSFLAPTISDYPAAPQVSIMENIGTSIVNYNSSTESEGMHKEVIVNIQSKIEEVVIEGENDGVEVIRPMTDATTTRPNTNEVSHKLTRGEILRQRSQKQLFDRLRLNNSQPVIVSFSAKKQSRLVKLDSANFVDDII